MDIGKKDAIGLKNGWRVLGGHEKESLKFCAGHVHRTSFLSYQTTWAFEGEFPAFGGGKLLKLAQFSVAG
jgi:hypothetical protein